MAPRLDTRKRTEKRVSLPKKVIVIGLDGLEPAIVESMMKRGELPNLARIRESGSYSRLQTNYPAQTPVTWSSFATGTNPGGHGIFDFIARDPATYPPDAALSRFGTAQGRLDEAAYLTQCELVLEERERLMRFELDRFGEGFFFLLYDTPDRVQHMLWRFRDPDHPGYEPDVALEFSTLIERHYTRCDKLLAPVLGKVDENTLLCVLSNHGFNTFRRAFDTNTWLWQSGLLALKDGRKPSEDMGDGYAAVDCSRTYAYAVGLGGIYLNLRGREREGILEKGTEAEGVRNAIQSGLGQISDAATQRVAIRSVLRKEALYLRALRGQCSGFVSKLLLGSRFLAECGPRIFQFADRGQHSPLERRSYYGPGGGPGYSVHESETGSPSSKAGNDMPHIIDLAPTILNYLGVRVAQTMEGSSLL